MKGIISRPADYAVGDDRRHERSPVIIIPMRVVSPPTVPNSQIDVENADIRDVAVPIPVVNPCAIRSMQPSVADVVCIRGEAHVEWQRIF